MVGVEEGGDNTRRRCGMHHDRKEDSSPFGQAPLPHCTPLLLPNQGIESGLTGLLSFIVSAVL